MEVVTDGGMEEDMVGMGVDGQHAPPLVGGALEVGGVPEVEGHLEAQGHLLDQPLVSHEVGYGKTW